MGTPQERAKGLLGLVREHADESESQRHLKGEVARAFAQEGLFRIAAPVDFSKSTAVLSFAKLSSLYLDMGIFCEKDPSSEDERISFLEK